MKTWLYCQTCKIYTERQITTSNNYSCNRCGGTLLTVDYSNIKTGVMYYPQVNGITPTVVKEEVKP